MHFTKPFVQDVYIAFGHPGLPTINSYLKFKFKFDINKDSQIKNIIIIYLCLQNFLWQMLLLLSSVLVLLLSQTALRIYHLLMSFSAKSSQLRFTFSILERIQNHNKMFKYTVLLKANIDMNV